MKDKHFIQDSERYLNDDSSHFMKELDQPLNDIELLELQGHIVALATGNADRDTMTSLKKFLEKNFI